MRLIFITVALALSLVGPTVGAAAPTVGGTVTTAAVAPVAGVRAELFALPSNYRRALGILDASDASAAGEPAATAAVDASGRFTLSAPAAGVWTVVVRAPGFVAMRYAPLPLAGAVELPPVALLPDAGAEVVVLSPGRGPAAGIWVLAETASQSLWEGAGRGGWRPAARMGRTDEEGRVTLPRAGQEVLSVHAFVPGSTEWSHGRGGAKVTLAPGAGTGAGPQQWIEVVGEDGRSLPGIVVAAGEPAWPLGVTGEDGRLRLRRRPSGPVALHFFAADGRTQAGVLKPSPESSRVPARFRLQAPRSVSGKVIDAGDGRAVAGALAWVAHDPGSFALTDARGRYQLPAPPAQRLSLRIGAAGYLPQVLWLHRTRAAAGVPLVALERAVSLRGQVVDAEGTPVAGAALEAARLGSEAEVSTAPHEAVSRATSDPAGRFVLPGLHPRGSYTVAARRQGFFGARMAIGRPHWPGDGSVEGGLRIVLERAGSAYGRVLDASDRPISGAEVRVAPAVGSESTAAATVTAFTDASGVFRVAAVPADRLILQVTKVGFSPLTVPGVAVPAGEGPAALGTLILVPGAAIEGRVSGLEGGPVRGAAVWLAEEDGQPPGTAEARLRGRAPQAVTDPDGRFRIGDLEPDRRLRLLVVAPGYVPAWRLGIQPPTVGPEAVEVALEAALQLSGRVVDEEGQPVAGARVGLRSLPPRPEELGPEVGSRTRFASAASDPAGHFTFSELAPGRVEITAAAEGFVPSPARGFHLDPAALPAPVEIVLERGSQIEGTITGPEGEAVAGARVRMGQLAATSDATGFYRLRGVPAGRQPLHVDEAHDKGYGSLFRWLEVAPGTNTVDLVLKGGFEVAGRVQEVSGSPVAGARLLLRRRSASQRYQYQTVSGPDGLFSLAKVAPGTYDVEAGKPGYASTELPRGLHLRRGPVVDLEVVLRQGATLSGRISGLRFEELAAVRVEARRGDAEPARRGRVDYEGRYEIRDLGAGDWVVGASLADDSRRAEARVTIEEGAQDLGRDLVFGAGYTLRGRVLLGGDPLSQTRVSLNGSDVAATRAVWTDHRGGFRIADVEAGEYRLGVTNASRGVLYSEDLTVAEDRDLLVEIETTRLSGTVISTTTGRPLFEALVSLRQLLGPGGSKEGSIVALTTGGDGTFTLGRITAGHYRLTVSKEGYAPSERVLDVEAGRALDGLELALAPTEGLDLVLRVASGRRIEYATVSVFHPAGGRLMVETRPVAEDGSVRFATVPPGTWPLMVVAPGSAPARVTVTVPGALREVVLPEGVRLDVRVPDLVESSLVAALTLLGPDGRPFQGMDLNGDLRERWSLPAGRGIVEGLPPGLWRVRAHSPDGRIWEGAVTASAGQQLEVTLR